MTEYEARLHSALALLAPDVDDTSAWDDVVARAGMPSRLRWKAAALALAALVATGVVAGAFAQGILSDSLDRLSSWAGEQPGAPDPEQQAAFDRENAAAYARFPTGTRIGRLLHADVGGRGYDLFGFRDGTDLCLRLVPFPVPPSPAVPECVPQSELTRLGTPIAPVGGHIRTRLRDGSGLTMVYGLAGDAVEEVEVFSDGRPMGSALVGSNAFLYTQPDEPGSPVEGPVLTVRARDADGDLVDVTVETGPSFSTNNPATLPGPDRVERTLTSGSIGWLERREARGEPFAWRNTYPQHIVWSRQLEPDPAKTFRVGIAVGQGTDANTRGRWYCLAWLWPLVENSFSDFCGRADAVDSGLTYIGAWPSAGVQFPLWIGMTSDDVASIELFRPDGSHVAVPLLDNVFTFQTSKREPAKLVAYDRDGRVVKIEVVGAPGSSVRGILIRP
jgi:hypothetical protein